MLILLKKGTVYLGQIISRLHTIFEIAFRSCPSKNCRNLSKKTPHHSPLPRSQSFLQNRKRNIQKQGKPNSRQCPCQKPFRTKTDKSFKDQCAQSTTSYNSSQYCNTVGQDGCKFYSCEHWGVSVWRGNSRNV